MRFQERDGEILTAIYEYGGVLARRHIKEIYWPDKSLRAMQKRMSALYHSGYISRTTYHYRMVTPRSEPIYWLGWKGILFVAGQFGVEIDAPKNDGESQMRKLQRTLLAEGIAWVRRPPRSLAHNFAVVDFRFLAENSLEELPYLQMETWVPERAFRSDMDVVAFTTKKGDGRQKKTERGVIPDGYFVLSDEYRRNSGKRHRMQFLLEIDLATHDTRSFENEKIAAGAAYVASPQYRARFGSNAGRWLVVTTGEVRMRNLMRKARSQGGAASGLFFFTIFDSLSAGNIFTTPIWSLAMRDEPVALSSYS